LLPAPVSGLDAQSVHDGHVIHDVDGLVEVQRAVELFEVDQIGQVRFGVTQDDKRPAGCGVRAGVERDDLKGDVGQSSDLEQVFQLGAQHLRAVRRPAQRRLVQHGPQLGAPAWVSSCWRRMRTLTRRSISSAGAWGVGDRNRELKIVCKGLKPPNPPTGLDLQ
jgi:hypothetical protein